MESQATQKFIRMSPRKLRLVADMVRKMDVQEALDTLPFVAKRAALPISKVIRSAAANAEAKGAQINSLTIKSIEVSEGPMLKRFRAVSRGQAHGFVKKMSHIKVVVDVKAEAKKVKKEKSTEKKGIEK
jgi:large subunit ribosomal protein L22